VCHSVVPGLSVSESPWEFVDFGSLRRSLPETPRIRTSGNKVQESAMYVCMYAFIDKASLCCPGWSRALGLSLPLGGVSGATGVYHCACHHSKAKSLLFLFFFFDGTGV
jgi:hypothetical protein